jgi:EpsI family protein
MDRSTKLTFAACVIVGVQVLATVAWSRPEYLPSPPPLSSLASDVGPWRMVSESELSPEVAAMLSPDDVLNREYVRQDNPEAHLSLFIAYYKSQHRAKQAHDPKVCLPGSGWRPVETRTISVPVPEANSSISANHYVVEKDGTKALVIYWYQTLDGSTARVQGLRVDNLFSTLKKNRSDMALVRIIVPVQSSDAAISQGSAEEFAKLIYPNLGQYFPATPAAVR